MPTPAEVRRHLAGLEALHHPVARLPLQVPEPRPLGAVLAEVADACRALHATTEGWRTFAPKPGALHDVELAAEGLRRTLAEVRVAVNDPPAAVGSGIVAPHQQGGRDDT